MQETYKNLDFKLSLSEIFFIFFLFFLKLTMWFYLENISILFFIM